jgi:hypothetical protein
LIQSSDFGHLHYRKKTANNACNPGLVPSRLETWWCAQHAVVMQPWHNARGAWYSHQLADGTWCTGQATTTDADTTARPHATHNQRGVYESL